MWSFCVGILLLVAGIIVFWFIYSQTYSSAVEFIGGVFCVILMYALLFVLINAQRVVESPSPEVIMAKNYLESIEEINVNNMRTVREAIKVIDEYNNRIDSYENHKDSKWSGKMWRWVNDDKTYTKITYTINSTKISNQIENE